MAALLYAIVNKPATPFLNVPGLRPCLPCYHAFSFSSPAPTLSYFFCAAGDQRLRLAHCKHIASDLEQSIANPCGSKSGVIVWCETDSLCRAELGGVITVHFLIYPTHCIFLMDGHTLCICFTRSPMVFTSKSQVFRYFFFLLYKYALRILYYGAGYGFVAHEESKEWAVSNKQWEGDEIIFNKQESRKLYTGTHRSEHRFVAGQLSDRSLHKGRHWHAQ
jgi:hypothetical protein